MISIDELSILGDPETSLKVKNPKTGVEGYRVGMEVFHHLHCLNLLRKVTYKEYYESLEGELSHGREALQAHTGRYCLGAINISDIVLDHCLEVLRLNIQCQADIGVFTLYMVEGDPLAWPRLNSNHQCRNFDRIREWALDHSVGNMEVE
jgi:hypothetical protein